MTSQHNYYISEHLHKLQKDNPDLYMQLETIVTQIHTLCNMNSDSLPLTFIDLVSYADLVNSLSELYHNINQTFRQKTGRAFFRRIDNYHLKKTHVFIALAIYQYLISRLIIGHYSIEVVVKHILQRLLFSSYAMLLLYYLSFLQYFCKFHLCPPLQ